MTRDSSHLVAATAVPDDAEARAVEHARTWLKSRSARWKIGKIILLLGFIITLIYYGKMCVASGYFVTFETWSQVTNLWHLVAGWLRHNIRGVIEGVLGGLIYAQVKFNSLARGHLAKAPEWTQHRLTIRRFFGRLGLVLVWGVPGFVLALTLIEVNSHSPSFHHFLITLWPGHYFYLDLARLTGHATWATLSSTVMGDLAQFVLGFATAMVFGRRAMFPVFWAYQHYQAASAVHKGRADRWFHPKGYLGLKEFYRHLETLSPGATLAKIRSQPKSFIWLVRVGMVASVPAFLGGVYIITVIAQRGH